MAKRLNVTLGMTADTKQAQAQLAALQTQLDGLINAAHRANPGESLAGGLSTAVNKATELKVALQQATDVKTGNLDLGKFTQSLNQNKTTLQEYANILISLGPEGQQAFANLAQAVTLAEVPMRRANGLLTEFATTLKNTVRWQFSSSMLHGFIGAVQSAYGYAQDLNRSLNDIRIVTGYSTDQMAKFAVEANKAAKALSTTTTEYTDASLIFYQQGLGNDAVEERTNAVIKMANVTGDSVEEVASYMTAIWNNFNKDGTQSVEHFADVITALGAATASSSAEIAAGLEKFAAIGEQIGLSYDYATTALATVVAQTRQSEDVVGTAFKTIFARIQGLKQDGETEDGTTLNKYSEALANVGISIRDTNGEIRDMDSILNDMGARWETLTTAQKLALAQTVAGVRQYNQLIALMDNWGTFQENLNIAQTSDGALAEQAEIYAESWEAAADRVKAALETIYEALLKDDFFIGVTDTFAKILDTVSKLIDGLGGLKGVLAMVSALMLKTFNKEIAAEMERMAYNTHMKGGLGSKIMDAFVPKENREKVREQRDPLATRKQASAALMKANVDDGTFAGGIAADAYAKQGEAQTKLIAKEEELLKKSKSLTEEERKRAAEMLDQLKTLGEQNIAYAKQGEAIEENLNRQKMQLANRAGASYGTADAENPRDFNADYDSLINLNKELAYGSKVAKDYRSAFTLAMNEDPGNKEAALQKLVAKIKVMTDTARDAQVPLGHIETILDRLGNADGPEEVEAALQDLEKAMNSVSAEAAEMEGAMADAFVGTDAQRERFGEGLGAAAQQAHDFGVNAANGAHGVAALGDQADAASQAFDKMNGKVPTVADGLVQIAQVGTSLAMTVSAVQSLVDVWNDADASASEKLVTTLTTLGMVIPTVVSTMKVLNIENIKSFGSAILAAAGFDAAAVSAVGFGTALWTALWPIGLVMLAVIALIAAIKLIWDAFHKANKRFNELNEAAEASANAFNEAAAAVNNLKSALDDLESKTDALKDMTYGTIEWANALQEVNNQMVDLIKQYDLQEGKDYFVDSMGAMQLTDAGKENVQTQAYSKMRNASVANTSTQHAKDVAHEAKVQEDIRNKYFVSNGSLDTLKQELLSGRMDVSGLDNIDALIAAGISQGDAEMIASNDTLQKEIADLANETRKNTAAYQTSLVSELASDRSVMDNVRENVSEEYQTSTLGLMASDMAAREKGLLSSVSADDIENNRDTYAKASGFTKKDDGWYSGDEKVDINDDAVKQWIAHKKAIEETRQSLDYYNKLAEKSNKIWAAADDMKDVWNSISADLKQAKKSGQDFAKVMDKDVADKVKAGLSEMLGVSEDMADSFLDPAFIVENSELIEDAINGDAKALDKLREKASEDVLISLVVDKNGNQLTDELNTLLLDIDNSLDDIEIGATLDNTEALAKMQELVNEGLITSEQLQNYLGLKGFEGIQVSSHTETVKIPWYARKPPIFGPKTEEVTILDIGGGTTKRASAVSKASPSSSGDSGADSGDSGGGGGGGDRDKKDEKNANGEIERYHVIKKLLEDQQRELERLSKAKDRAYGASRLALLDQEIAKTKEAIQTQKDYISEISNNLQTDGNIMAGYGASFDAKGNISNYDSLMQQQIDKYNAAVQKYNAGGGTEQEMQQAENDYTAFKEALEQYEDTLSTLYDAEDELLAKLYEMQDFNFEKLMYEVELKLTVNENELKELDYYFEKLSDDAYKAAEALAILDSKMTNNTDTLGTYSDQWDKLSAAYAAGDISQAAFIEGAQGVYEALYDQLTALQDLDKAMNSYYGDTLALVNDELDKVIKRQSALNNTLDHYQKIMKLTGQQFDFKKFDVIYSAQEKLAENSYTNSKAIYEMYQSEADAWKERMDSVEKGSAAWETYEKAWLEAQEKAEDAQDQMLSDLESWAEAVAATLENKLAAAAAALEDAFTQGMGFDALNDSLTRLQSNQEEYLTQTNKVYETNKMLNKLSQAIDKTTNQSAKAKYKEFATEIQGLQDKTKLSKLELEIAQKKYALLEAQIALEEAQNAKSMVRLTRDAEGNYGYVYTADEDKTADAQQNVADAENDLYNTRLKAANDYGQKILKLNQECTSKLAEIDKKYQEGAYASEEEYLAARQQVIDEYYALYTTYSNLYGVAQEGDARVAQDAWINAYGGMITSADEWKEKVGGYVTTVDDAWDDYGETIDTIKEEAGTDLGELKTKTEEITTASDALTKKLNDELVPAMSNELQGVRDAITEYGLKRQAILDNIAAYEELAQKLKEKIKIEIEVPQIQQPGIESVQTPIPEFTPTENPNVEIAEPDSGSGGGGDSGGGGGGAGTGADAGGYEEIVPIEEKLAEMEAAVATWWDNFCAWLQEKIFTPIANFFGTTIDKIKEIWNNFIAWSSEKVDSIVGAIVNFFTKTIPDAWNKFKTWWDNTVTWENIGRILGEAAGHVYNFFTKDLPAWIDKVKTKIADWFDQLITEITEFFTETIPEAWDTLVKFLSENWEKIIDALKTFFTETIPNAWDDFWGWLCEKWDALVTGARTFFTETMPEFFRTLFTETIPQKWAEFKSWLSQKKDEIVNGVKEFFTVTVPNFFTTLFKETIPNKWNEFTSWLKEKRDALVNGVRTLFCETIPQKIGEAVSAVKRKAADIINGLIGILNSGLQKIANVYNNSVGKFLGGFANGFEKVTGIELNLPVSLNWGNIPSVSFDTGGYTGEWGPDGKMAMLHEKELVLNAGDTENFLRSMGMLKDITAAIEKSSAYAALGLGGAVAASGYETSSLLEQQVTITAEFPNVTDRNEIEEALNSLVNRASQFAYQR